METCLVTGGAGFIGSHVVDALLEEGYKVIVLDDLSGGFEDNVNPKAEFVKGSVVDHELVDSLFVDHKIDYVFHLAAYAAEILSPHIRRFNYEVNLIGSVNLINNAVNHKVKNFVFTSSIGAYGNQKPPFDEDTVPLPADPYGTSKYAVEIDLKNAHDLFGLNYIIFRPHNVYGERQNLGDKYRNVLGIFMNQIMQGKELTIFGDGEQTRAFSYIGNMAPIIAKSIKTEGATNQIFNIGADQPYSINQLSDEIMKAMGKTVEKNYLKGRHEVKHAYCSHDKIKKVFGDVKTTSLQDGIKKMAEWAKEAGIRESKPFDNIEVKEGLPEGW
jgi:UDP-glucose 4-epimerase